MSGQKQITQLLLRVPSCAISRVRKLWHDYYGNPLKEINNMGDAVEVLSRKELEKLSRKELRAVCRKAGYEDTRSKGSEALIEAYLDITGGGAVEEEPAPQETRRRGRGRAAVIEEQPAEPEGRQRRSRRGRAAEDADEDSGTRRNGRRGPASREERGSARGRLRSVKEEPAAGQADNSRELAELVKLVKSQAEEIKELKQLVNESLDEMSELRCDTYVTKHMVLHTAYWLEDDVLTSEGMPDGLDMQQKFDELMDQIQPKK